MPSKPADAKAAPAALASLDPSSAASKLLGPYHLGECIGRGGFGAVYRGLNIQTGRTVALKRVSMDNVPKDELVGIESEIQLLKKLKHPNIVKYIDTIRTEHNLNIIIEYVENGSLANIVKKFGGSLPETLVAIYISQVLKGLDYLHTQGVIHRDIKGANILATKDGLIKLADFGVATKINESNKSDSVVGTPYWMAPEIIEMSGSQSTACDIWSVGCTVVELLTGSPPYFNLQPMPALFRIVQDEHPPLPAGLSSALEDFLLLCFQKDPNMRSKAEDLLKHQWLRSPAHSDIRSQIDVAAEEEPDIADAMQQTIRLFQGDLKKEMDDQRAPADEEESASPTRRIEDVEVNFDNNDEEDWDAEFDAEDVPTVRFQGKPADAVQKQQQQSMVANAFVDDDDIETIRLSEPIKAKLPKKKEAKPAKMMTEAKEDEDFSDGFSDMSSEPEVEIGPRPSAGDLLRFAEDDAAEDDFFGELGEDDADFAIDAEKVEVQKNRVWDSHGEDAVVDPFADQGFDEVDLVGDEDAKVAEKVHLLLQALSSAIDRQTPVQDLLQAVNDLSSILRENPSQISTLVTRQGVIPIIEMLDLSEIQDETVLVALLALVRQIMTASPRIAHSLCLVGLIPIIVQLIDSRVPLVVRVEASHYITLFCSSISDSSEQQNQHQQRKPVVNLSRQIFIACGGLQSLISMLDLSGLDFDQHKQLVWTGVDCINMVFDTPTNPKNDFCRLFCKAGLLKPLTQTLTIVARHASDERCSTYMDKMLQILLIFAERGDAIVKGYLAKRPVLENLLSLLDVLSDRSVVVLLKAIRVLTMEVHIRDALEQCGAIPKLIRLLNSPDPAFTNHILPAMYYLFRIKASRQEQMAICGIIPLLQRNIVTDNHLKQFALPMICKLAHTSRRVRQELKKYAGVEFYLDLLSEPYWQMQAMDALSVWLADEPDRVQAILVQNHNLHKLIQVFRATEKNVFGSILRSLSKIIVLSAPVNRALGRSGPFLNNIVHRLRTSTAIVQKPLLELVGLLYSKHDDRREMGAEDGLEQIVRELAEQDVSVLVQAVASNILRDFDSVK